jgi:LacI family transcriptional regulator
LQAEREQGMAIVFVDRPPVGLAVDAVLSNNYTSALAATRHLIERGHRQIAHLGDELTISTARERRRGYSDAMLGAGLTDDPSQHIDNLRSEEEAYAAVQRLMRLEAPPTALFTSQNLVTIGAVKALHHLGLQHRIAVVGFDDVPFADLVEPGVTVMAQDPGEIGTRAAQRMFARLDGDTSPAQEIVVPTQLIVRGSGEIAPPA